METKKKRTQVLAGLLALVGLLLVWTLATAGDLEPSGAPGPTMKTLDEVEPRIPIHASDLPLTITETGSYYLVGDVNFTDTVNHAITIDCNDVTIDLMGYTLKGPDSGPTSGICMDGRSNVEIRNGTIRDFVCGIGETNPISSNHRVINMRFLSNNSYGIYLLGTGNLIKDCTFAASGWYGISVGSRNMLTNNTVYDNGAGICSGGGCTLTGNTVYDNNDVGILTDKSTVTGNNCYGNANHGIYVWSVSTVVGNTCCGNGDDGINANSGSTVTGNTCYENGDDGIYAGDGSTVVGNTTRSNTDYGINVATYCLIDQNTAYGNTAGNLNYGVGCVLGTNCAP